MTQTSGMGAMWLHKRVLAASLIGTAVEFYDFYIYATAASLIFPSLFFPASSPSAQLMASYGSLALAFLAMAATYVTLASFEFVLVAMQLDLLFSTDSANSLAYMPAAASLMVVFIAGSLADRWGPRRLLVIAVTLFTSGAVLVGIAPGLTWVVVGRILDGVGGVTMAIVALSVM